MPRSFLPALAVLLALASAARADTLLDRQAPEPAAAKWVAGEAPPALKALKGRAALVELLDPDDLVCQGLVSRTVEIAARAAERNLLVLTVAVGAGADEATSRAFAKQFRIAWPLAVDRGSETFLAYGMPSLPRYFLVTPDGRVAWEGSPGALDDRSLALFLERCRLWRTEEVAKGARPAAESFVKGKYAAAVRKATELVGEVKEKRGKGQPVDDAAEKDAQVVLDAVADIAAARFANADRLAKERWSLDAREILEGVAAAFVGTEHEAKAKERLAAIAGDARAQYEITAMIRLREILGKMRPLTRHTVTKAIEALDAFVIPYAGAVSGDRGKAERARLQKLLEKL